MSLALPRSIAILAALVVVLPSAVGSQATVQIQDASGDASPTAAAVSLGLRDGLGPYDAMLDLLETYVALENADSVALRFHVRGIDDRAVLAGSERAGVIAGAPSPSAVWDAAQVASQVQYTAYFTIEGKAYSVVAHLARVDLGPAAPADPATAIGEQLAVAAGAVAEAQRATGAAPLGGIRFASLNSVALPAADPEVVARAAVAKALEALAAATALGYGLPVPDAAMAPLEGAYEALSLVEALQSGALGLGLLPDVDPLGLLGGEDPAVADPATGLAQAQALIAKARAALPAPVADALPADTAAPVQLLFDGYELRDPQGNAVPLEGAVDVEADTVTIRVPKKLIGTPARGTLLTEFRATADFSGALTDFGPDAEPVAPASAAGQGALMRPRHGESYSFVGADPTIDTLKVTADEPLDQSIEAGGVATYFVTLENVGTVPLAGVFAFGPADAGWTAQVRDTVWALAPGSSESYAVTVSALEGGAKETTTRVAVSPEGGATQYAEFHTMLAAKAAVAKEGKGIPGFEAVAVLAVVGLAIALGRRRK